MTRSNKSDNCLISLAAACSSGGVNTPISALVGRSRARSALLPSPSLSLTASSALSAFLTLLKAAAFLWTVEAIQGEGGVVLDGVHTSDVDGSTSSSGELSSGFGEPAAAAADASAALTVSSFMEAAFRRSLLMVPNWRWRPAGK